MKWVTRENAKVDRIALSLPHRLAIASGLFVACIRLDSAWLLSAGAAIGLAVGATQVAMMRPPHARPSGRAQRGRGLVAGPVSTGVVSTLPQSDHPR
jgi:hypothetical protein